MEHEPHKKGNKLSDVILGGQDGLVSILGLLLGLSVATSSTKIVIAGGLATIIAETISMGAVAYTSKMADKEHYAAERLREIREIKEFPDIERQEIVDIYMTKGFKGKLLDDVVKHVTSNEELWVDTMMRDELDLIPVVKRDVYVYSATVGLSTLIGAMLPLVPYFFLSVHVALYSSLVLASLILAMVGVYKARLILGNPLKVPYRWS